MLQNDSPRANASRKGNLRTAASYETEAISSYASALMKKRNYSSIMLLLLCCGALFTASMH